MQEKVCNKVLMSVIRYQQNFTHTDFFCEGWKEKPRSDYYFPSRSKFLRFAPGSPSFSTIPLLVQKASRAVCRQRRSTTGKYSQIVKKKMPKKRIESVLSMIEDPLRWKSLLYSTACRPTF